MRIIPPCDFKSYSMQPKTKPITRVQNFCMISREPVKRDPIAIRCWMQFEWLRKRVQHKRKEQRAPRPRMLTILMRKHKNEKIESKNKKKRRSPVRDLFLMPRMSFTWKCINGAWTKRFQGCKLLCTFNSQHRDKCDPEKDSPRTAYGIVNCYQYTVFVQLFLFVLLKNRLDVEHPIFFEIS